MVEPERTDGASDGVEISALTLATADIEASVGFYERLGFVVSERHRDGAFVTLEGDSGPALNLVHTPEYHGSWFGRVILQVPDVDRAFRDVVDAGFEPHGPPEDASWGERYFHVCDPDGHEVSIARPLRRKSDLE